MKQCLLLLLLLYAFFSKADSLKEITKLEESGNYVEALKIATASLKTSTSNIHQIELNKRISIIYFKLGNQAESIIYVNKAIHLANLIENDTLLGKLYNNKGILFSLSKQHDSSLVYYQKALQIKLRLNDTKGTNSTYNNMGVAYEKSKNYKRAITFYKKALELQLKLNDKTKLSKSLNNLGSLYSHTLQYDSAYLYYSLALKGTANNSNPRLKAKIFLNFKKLMQKKGNFEKAIYYSDIYNQMKDSLFNLEKAIDIANLELRNETEQQKYTIAIQEEKIRRKAIVLSFTIILVVLLTAIIIGGIYHYRKIQQKSKQLQAVQEKAFLNYIKGQETERMRIAFHLHDDLNNTLMSAKITEEKDQYVLEALEILNSATSRVFSEKIRAFGLHRALIGYITNFHKKEIEIYYSSNIEKLRFPIWIEASIYRIVTGLIECAIEAELKIMHLYLTWNKEKVEIDLITEKFQLDITRINVVAASLLTVLRAEIVRGEEAISIEIPLKKEDIENELANS